MPVNKMCGVKLVFSYVWRIYLTICVGGLSISQSFNSLPAPLPPSSNPDTDPATPPGPPARPRASGSPRGTAAIWDRVGPQIAFHRYRRQPVGPGEGPSTAASSGGIYAPQTLLRLQGRTDLSIPAIFEGYTPIQPLSLHAPPGMPLKMLPYRAPAC